MFNDTFNFISAGSFIDGWTQNTQKNIDLPQFTDILYQIYAAPSTSCRGLKLKSLL